MKTGGHLEQEVTFVQVPPAVMKVKRQENGRVLHASGSLIRPVRTVYSGGPLVSRGHKER